MTVYLRGPAVLALSEVPDGLVDEENYRRYLPMVRDVGRTIYAERGADLLGQIGEASAQFEEIDNAQLAALAARSTYTLRF